MLLIRRVWEHEHWQRYHSFRDEFLVESRELREQRQKGKEQKSKKREVVVVFEQLARVPQQN